MKFSSRPLPRPLYRLQQALLARHLLIAILISLFLHLLLLAINIKPPRNYASPHERIMQVKLDDRKPQPKTQMPAVEEAPKPQPAGEALKQETRSNPISTPTSAKIQNAQIGSGDIQPAKEASPEVPVSDKSIDPAELSRRLNDGPVNKLNMEFEVFEGAEHGPVGKAFHHYESDVDGNYYLDVTAGNFKTDVEGAASGWTIGIEGNVSEHGLRPKTYTRNGEMARKLMSLSGDEDNTETRESGMMPDAILDRVSMLYQFMNADLKEDRGTLLLTDGHTISTFNYHIEGTEPIKVPRLGTVKSRHIAFTNVDNAETIDLWLASSLRNAPVKVIYKSVDGAISEQVVSSISIK